MRKVYMCVIASLIATVYYHVLYPDPEISLPWLYRRMRIYWRVGGRRIFAMATVWFNASCTTPPLLFSLILAYDQV
jgi:hypothetical protein